MTIGSLQTLPTDFSVFSNEKSVDNTFSLQAAPTEDESKKTKREIEVEKTEEEIQEFFATMKKYGNALTYVVQSNLEKIKEMIEAKKEELKEANGFYSEPPLSPEQKAELMKGIEDALAQYKKELLKELEEKAKAEKDIKQKNVSLKDVLAS